MTTVDALGYVASSLVLATFTAKSMVGLRTLAIGSNIAFIAYSLSAALWPILLLHSIMLPLNLIRLREALGDAPALGIRIRRLGSQQAGGRYR
jgi:CRP/FNR family transcriptional regulator, cyclic AMP receptor protein